MKSENGGRKPADELVPQGEATLQGIEELHRAILQTAMDGFWLVDKGGRLLEVNETYCRMSGYTAEELLSLRICNLEAVITEDQIATRIQEILGHGPLRFESRHRRKDGTAFDVEVSAHRCPTKEGRVVVFLRDITERKRAEDELRKLQTLLDQTQEITKVGGWEYDVPGKRLFWTTEVFRIHEVPLDYDPNDLAQCIDFYAVEDRPRIAEAFRRAVEEGESYDLELRLDTAQGRRLWVRTSGRAERQQGKVVRVVGNLLDVTQSKLEEETLRRTQFAVDNASDAIGWVRPDGTYAYVNIVSCRLLGYSREEMLGKAVSDIHLGMTVERWQAYWEQLKRDGSLRYEGLAVTKDGRRVPVEATASYVAYEGQEFACCFARDISDRKRAEEKLHRSEASLAEAQRLAHLGSWEWSIETNEVLWSEETYRLFGLTRGNFDDHRESFLDLIVPEDRARVDQALSDALSGAQEYDLDYRVKLPTGAEKVLHARAQVIRNSEGKPTLMRGTVQDITERRQAEAEKRETEQRFTKAFENASIGMALVSTEGHWIRVNRAICQMLGRSAAELLATTFQAITHPDDLDADLAQVRQMLRGDISTYQMEKRYFHQSGAIVWGLLSVSLVKDERGAPRHFISQVVDITERKRVEDALRKSEERFRRIVETAREGVWAMDREHRTTFVNDQMGRMLGCEPGEIVGRVVEDFMFEEDLPAHQERMARRHQGAGGDYEHRFRRHDGSVLWTIVSATALTGPEGHFDGSFAMFTDITKRKEAEEALQASETLLNETQRLSKVGGWEWDIGRQHMDWTEETYRLHGLSAQDFAAHSDELIRSSAACYAPEHRTAILEAFRRCAELGEAYDLEVPFTSVKGRSMWVRTTAQAVWEGNRIVRVIGNLLDITERKQAEEALRRNEARQGKMVANIGDVIVIIDQDGINRYKSPNIEKWFGWRPEDLVGFRALENVHPEDRDSAQRFLGVLLAQPNTTATTECRYRCKDGRYKWIEFTGVNLVHDPDIQGILGNYHDISERRRLEAERQRALGDYQVLFNKMIEGFAVHEIICDQVGEPTDYRFLAVNPAFENLTGLKAESLVGHTAREAIPNIEPFWIETYGKVALTGEPAFFENYSTDLEKHFQVTAFQPAPKQFACIFADITQRKRAEEALQESQQELQAIYDSSPIMMCLVNRQGKVEQMNRTMLEFVGGETSSDGQRFPGDLLGCVNALDDPRGCNFGTQCKTCPLRLAMAQTFETGQPCGQVEAELFLVRSRVRRQVRVSASTGLVRLADQPRALICLEDITNRKLLEEQLRQSQKLESVGQLAGGVAHDFNNILAAVMMQLSLLQRNSSLDQDTRESVKELMTEAKRGASLTRQLLMFSRRSVLEVKVLDLTELVANMLKMLGRLIGEQITIRFDRREGLPLVEADPGMIEQVLMNLAVNARDAMPKGGDLTIKIEAVQVEPQRIQKFAETRPGLFVCLSMRDTGCGMDAHTLQKVFEPFFTTKEPGKGTGLGLATVHGIVAQHKGWVEVESELAKGSLFRVFLPTTPSISPQPMEIPDQPTAFGHETILVVEDEASVRNGLLRNLKHLGYRVFAAANGREAMKVWREHSPQVDLLLSDMVMPEGMTGLDLAEKLRLEKPGLSVIISSGYNSELVGRGALQAEGVIYLGKPYDIEALSKTIRDCLDQK